ncbi:hypothetical protein GOP47_0022957 [Adiantum capillus-veneris]|uniref:F-box domain-containing protein n=1 Tax=Adiantum capillus-veneris TaxID=13818 RepID=A0A9D4U7H0_ADICA|nr:hypothetical protein GOP47_0022957 [Adiantum capillus-veneris]
MGQTTSSAHSPSAPPLLSSTQRAIFNTRDAEVPSSEQDLTLHLLDECLASILHKLSTADRHRCSLVCKRWHFVESTSRDRLALHAEAAIEPHLSLILSRYTFVTYLSLRCSRKEVSIDSRALVLIGKHCTNLSRLKLKCCKAISDDGLAAFAEVRGHSLKKFSCGSCGFSSKGLNPLLENCPKLEDLSVKRLRRSSDEPQPILPGASRLRRLCLKEVTCTDVFGTLISGSKQLRTLVLARNPDMWDSFFTLICENLSELVELHIDFLKISGVALTAIANCSKLEVLHVSKVWECSNTGIAAIANGCRGLKKLYIDDRSIHPVGDEGLLVLGNYCTKLQELVLIGVSVTKSSLDVIASNCTVLERMALCSTEAVGDTELSCIAERCISLKKLCIKNCPISDVGIEGLVKGCPSLTKVKVKRCKDVTMVSALLFHLSRPSVTASLDIPVEVRHEDEDLSDSPGHDPLNTRNRVFLGKSRLLLAAGNLLRRFPKPS